MKELTGVPSSFRNLGKSGLRVSCLGLGECHDYDGFPKSAAEYFI